MSRMSTAARWLIAGFLALSGAPALAGTHTFTVYLDTDNNAATGCVATTSKGPFAGAELALVTTVITSTSGAQVAGVQLATCSGGTFGAPQTIDAGEWPVGLGNGDGGTALIETYLPVPALAGATVVRAAIAAAAQGGGADAMLVAPGNGPILIQLPAPVAQIPTLSASLLACLALILGLAGWCVLSRRGRYAGLFLVLLIGGATVTLAVVLDGLASDWVGVPILATAPLGDGTPVNARLVSFYAQVADQKLYLRIDANVQKDQVVASGPPTLDPVPNQAIPSNTTLSLRLVGHNGNGFGPLTYSLQSGPQGAAVTPLGVFTFTPSTSQLGSQGIGVQVQQGDGRTAQTAFTVTVVDHDHAPVLGPLTDDTTSIGASYTKILTASDPDAGDTLTFTLVSGPAGMTLAGSTLAWKPTAAQLGNWPVRVKVTDRAGLSASGLFHVGIPFLTATDDEYSVNLGKTLSVAAPGVLGNDVDPLSGPLAATKLSDPDKGTLTAFGADGSFTFQAPAVLPGPVFAPVVKYHLDGVGFSDPALVADVDGDGKPELIFLGAGGGAAAGITALRGTDGSVLWHTPALPAPYDDCTAGLFTGGNLYHLALGDIDDSGQLSIVFPTSCGRDNLPTRIIGTNTARYAALNARDGSFKWLSPPLSRELDANGNPDSLAGGTVPTLARVRVGETPSIVVGANVSYFTFNGKPECDQLIPGWPINVACRGIFVLDGKDGAVRQRMAAPQTAAYDITTYGNGTQAAVVADLDGDGNSELVFGGAVFNNDGSIRWNNTDDSTGHPQSFWNGVANFDDTPDIEVARLEGNGSGSGPSRLAVYKSDGRLLWSLPLPSTAYTGIPVIADVDGSGRPAVVLFIDGNVCAVDYRGNYKWCHDVGAPGGVSNVSLGSRVQVYDLDGDGVAEVIVAVNPEILLFLDGATGNVKSSLDMNAANGPPVYPAFLDFGIGGPIVADVDGSGHAAIVSLWGGNGRLDVVAAQNNDWRPARKIFNQESYQFGNVNDDGTIPQTFVNNFATPATNVFGAQAQVLAPVDPRKKSQTVFTYSASDGPLTSAPGNVTIDILPADRPPVFVSQPPTRYVVNAPFTYAAQAIDSDSGDTVTYSLKLAQGNGGGVVGNCAMAPATGVLACGILFTGEQDFVIVATDSFGASAYQTIQLQPSPGPAAVPNVVGLAQAAANATLTAAGFATGDVHQLDNPAPAGQVIQQSPGAGTQALLGSLIDLVVSNGPPLPPPPPGPPPQLGNIARIVVAPATALRLVGEAVPYKATAIYTDHTGADITLFATWSSSAPGVATVDAAGTAHAVGPGSTLLTATAGGLSGEASLSVAARVAPGGAGPSAAITQPASGGTVTGLTQILGSAAGAPFLRYELALAASGDAIFTLIGQGTAPVTDGVLGTLDPTLLLNGAYVLRLTVFDAAGNTATAQVPMVADGYQKIGNFTLGYVDLTAPLAGIPIQVNRLYDSRDKRAGDFGVGWRLGMKDALRVSASGVLGTTWQVIQQETTFGLVPGSDHFVSVTLPSGKVDTFDLQLAPTASFLVPFTTLQASFVARPGTLGSLSSVDNTNLLITDPQPGPVTLLDDTTLNTFDPDRFLYTQFDGTRVVVSRTHGIESVTDTNGNQITIGPGGISHSSGTAIVFTRDAGGRITAMTDPKGQIQTYLYSPAGDLASHTDAAGRTTRYFYNAQHGLVRIEDPLGVFTARTEYDDNGRVISVTDAVGHTTTYNPDLPGRQEQVTDALGRTTLLNYDDSGNVLSKTDTLGNTSSFTYDGDNNQLTQTDPLGRVASKTYDSLHNVLTSSDFDGNITVSSYDARGHLLTTIDPEGRTTTNAYDANGNLTQVTDPEGGITQYTYDGAGNRLSATNPLGNVTRFAYDAAGNLTSSTDPLGNVATTTYDALGNRTSLTDAAGKTTLFAYDAAGRVTTVTDPLGGVTTIAYSNQGDGQSIASKTDALGRVTSFEYDPLGNLLKTTFPDLAVTSTTYDIDNNVSSATDADGFTTAFKYDALGRLTSTAYPDGTTTSQTYDTAGRVQTQTDERGNTTNHGHAPDQETITDALGKVTVFKFDGSGHRVRLTDALGRVTSFTYDSAGNLTRTTFPDGTFKAATLDAAKRKTAEIDQAGVATQFAYDAVGRLLRVLDAAGGTTSYTYDPAGHRLTATDANGHTTRISSDALGRVVGRTRPSGAQETFSYDAVGNQVSHTDFNGRTTTFTYDAMNRLTQKAFQGAGTLSYAYSPTGRRTRAGGDSYAYDARGRLLEEYKASGAKLTYTHDAAGNISSVTTASGTTTYTHDALNRLATVVDAAGTTAYGYDAVGNLASTAYPNGVTAVDAYDALNRLVQVRNLGPAGLISSYDYTLGPAGNRLQVVEGGSASAGRTVAYSFDAVYRLTLERITLPAVPNTMLSYSYDAVGNRTGMNRDAAATTYAYDADDRLLTEASGGVTLTSTYDNNGNETAQSNGLVTVSYTYDAENRLLGAAGPAGAVSYSYDADGMRTSSTKAGVTTTFLVDKAGAGTSCGCKKDSAGALAQVLVETTGASVVTYTYGLALVDQTQTGFGTHFYLADGQLSTRQLTDAAGAVTDGYTFDAFGVILAATGPTPNNYLYTGQQLDPNLGFYYLRARYYDAAAGRFLTTDPEAGNIYDPVSLHRYLYAGANPVDHWDPSGASDLSLASISIANTISIGLEAGLVVTAIGVKGFAMDWKEALGYGALTTGLVITTVFAAVPAAGLAISTAGLEFFGVANFSRFVVLLQTTLVILNNTVSEEPIVANTVKLENTVLGNGLPRVLAMVKHIGDKPARCLALKGLQFGTNLILETTMVGVVEGQQAPSLTIPAFGSYSTKLVVGEAAIENLRKEINQIFYVAIATTCN